jgi:hypothetical protein
MVAASALVLVVAGGAAVWQLRPPAGPSLAVIDPGISVPMPAAAMAAALAPATDDTQLVRLSYQTAFGRDPNPDELKWWLGVVARDSRWRSLDLLVFNHRNWLQGAGDEISQTAFRAVKAALGGQTVPSYYYDTLTKAPVPIYTEMVARTVIMEGWLQMYGRYPADTQVQTYAGNGTGWAPAQSVAAMKQYLAGELRTDAAARSTVIRNAVQDMLQRQATDADLQRWDSAVAGGVGYLELREQVKVAQAQPQQPKPPQPQPQPQLVTAPPAPIGPNLKHAIDAIWWVTWEERGTNVTGFRLMRKGAQERDFTPLADKPKKGEGEGHMYTDTTAVPAQSWTYKVCAYNSAGETCSAEASTAASVLPPRNLRATGSTARSLTLQFTQAGNGVQQFTVMAKSGSDWSPVGQVNATGGDGTVYTYTDTGLQPNLLRTYRVCAVGDGSPCGEELMTATSPDYAPAPAGLTVSAVNATQVRLDWTPDPRNQSVSLQLYLPSTNQWKNLATLQASQHSYVDNVQNYTMPAYQYRTCDGAGYTCSEPVVIGRQFDHPYNFTHLDTGIYWFRCGDCRASERQGDNGKNSDGAKAVPGLSREYFDPSKPTVIYVHGWEHDTVKDRFRESMKSPISEYDKSVMESWQKDWNVGIFYWNQFSDDDWSVGIPYYAEGKIWGDAKDGMTHVISDGNGGWQWGSEAVPKASAAELFLDTYLGAMQGYDGRQQEIRIVGHSLGNQMAVRMTKLLAERGDHQELMPKRIALIDPFYSSDDRKNATANAVTWLKQQQQIVFEMYQTSALSSPGKVADLTVYTRVHPDYAWKTDQKKAHVSAIHWYFLSKAYSPPAYATGWFGAGADYNTPLGTTPTAGMDTETLRNLQGSNAWWEQDGGKDTWWLSDDKFVKHSK